MKSGLLKSPAIQAVFLAVIQAFGWLYLHSLIEYIFYGGGHSLGSGIDIGPIIYAWFCALVWGWFVCNRVSILFIGVKSRIGYISSGFLSIPVGTLFSLQVEPYMSYAPRPTSAFFAKSFYVFGLFGMLTEGQKGLAVSNALNCYVMAILGFFGFYMTASKVKNLQK